MCGDPQALIWAKKIGFGAFLGSQSCPILKITVFANLKISILDNYCCMTYPQKMPLSTLKLQILNSRIS